MTAADGLRVSRLAYPATWLMLTLAFAFPFALMVLDPALMFERGWEQYVGTGIYLWAVATLALMLARLARNERAFDDAARHLDQPRSIEPSDVRLLPARLRLLTTHAAERVPVVQLMELNRESSSLDQEHAHGRFTVTRYILYLLPVIGFIGTVEGISKALMNISKVLPMVKELDGFLANLTGVTAALQIAFDSTLLALFLSAALMLIQTLVIRRSDDLLARVDGWIVEHALPRLGMLGAPSEPLDRAASAIEALATRLDAGLGGQVERFGVAIDRLTASLAEIDRGAAAVGRLDGQLATLTEAADAWRKAAASLARLEATVAHAATPDERLDAIRRGVDRAGAAVEALSGQWSAAFEKSSRATQEQLARTLGNLKDALELLHVSIDQGNALYRSIVKKIVPYPTIGTESEAA
jgi:biopolymer transport protein ExbB/TolQ